MSTDIQSINELNYPDENLYRSYHKSLANYRINDPSIKESVRLRDQYFKLVEETNLTRNQTSKTINIYNELNDKNVNTEELNMSAEDKAILQQERRDDPTYDDSFERAEYEEFVFNENTQNEFDNILNSIDKDSVEYQDIQKLEELFSNVLENESTFYNHYVDEVLLTNSDLDKDLNIHFKDDSYYTASYNNYIESENKNLFKYDFDEELNIDNQARKSSLDTEIDLENKSNKLEVEYDKYKDKAVNIVEKFPEDINKIERELENYEFASENYHEYLKDKYTDFNQYLKDNNISNPYEKYSDDLIKNTKIYSNIRLKMEEIDDEHFSQHGKHVSNYSEEIKSTPQNLQKLKSVELEKNVIGLLPKEQQENTFKETLSRLDNNKTSLKDNLKNYMSNEKIDNVINSVKQHFENIKVKAEDVQQTFKDLGSWNTENKFIKNIDNVVDKVKGIAQNNEDKLDINDPDLLKKLETKFKESNDFIENIEKTNNIDDQLSNERLKFHENTLKIINPEMESTTNTITSSLSDLSKEDKLNLYNYSKDINSLNQEKNFNKPENIKTAIESQKLINSIENEFGKSTVDESRKEYLVSNTAKPTVNNNFNDNPTLKNFTNNANQFITNIDKNDLKSYQQNCNVEVSKINNNQKSNTLKNNDLLQKYNNQNEPKQQQSNTQEEEQKNEKSIKKGRTHSM